MNPPDVHRPNRAFLVWVALFAVLTAIVVMVLLSPPEAHATRPCKRLSNACHGTVSPGTQPEETTTTTEPETSPSTWAPSTTIEYLGEDGRPEARETEAHPAVPVPAQPTFTG